MLRLDRPEPTWPAAPDFAPLRRAFEDAIVKGDDGRAEWRAWSDAWAAHVAEYRAVSTRITEAHARKVELFGAITREANLLVSVADRVGGDINLGTDKKGSHHYGPAEHQERVDAWRALVGEYLGEDASAVGLDAEVPAPYYRPIDRVVDVTWQPAPYSQAVDAVVVRLMAA
jgi:hypothetical protein